jgi:hypothetical protein
MSEFSGKEVEISSREQIFTISEGEAIISDEKMRKKKTREAKILLNSCKMKSGE